jgi:hypothetical protein
MEYEVCYVDSLLFTVISLYRTEQDYEKGKPAEIYLITTRRNLDVAERRFQILKMKYREAKVELLIDKRGKDTMTPILDKCYNAKKVISPSLW